MNAVLGGFGGNPMFFKVMNRVIITLVVVVAAASIMKLFVIPKTHEVDNQKRDCIKKCNPSVFYDINDSKCLCDERFKFRE